MPGGAAEVASGPSSASPAPVAVMEEVVLEECFVLNFVWDEKCK